MPDDNSDVTGALDRMVEIGWVREYAYSPSRGFVVDFTDLGRERVSGFYSFISELGLERLDHVLWRGIMTVAFLKFGSVP